jgi:hypothetical protein
MNGDARLNAFSRDGFQIWPHVWQRQYTSSPALAVVVVCSERQKGHVGDCGSMSVLMSIPSRNPAVPRCSANAGRTPLIRLAFPSWPTSIRPSVSYCAVRESGM